MEIYIYTSDKPIASAHSSGPTAWIAIETSSGVVSIFLPENSRSGPALAKALNRAFGNHQSEA
jgi:hypothetical protein